MPSGAEEAPDMGGREWICGCRCPSRGMTHEAAWAPTRSGWWEGRQWEGTEVWGTTLIPACFSCPPAHPQHPPTARAGSTPPSRELCLIPLEGVYTKPFAAELPVSLCLCAHFSFLRNQDEILLKKKKINTHHITYSR